MEHTEDLNTLKERLAALYPGWHFWRARTERGLGSLMATRIAHITDDRVRQGLARTLPYGITGTLEEQLAEQTLKEAALLSTQEALQ